jgi:hypothetical protein
MTGRLSSFDQWAADRIARGLAVPLAADILTSQPDAIWTTISAARSAVSRSDAANGCISPLLDSISIDQIIIEVSYRGLNQPGKDRRALIPTLQLESNHPAEPAPLLHRDSSISLSMDQDNAHSEPGAPRANSVDFDFEKAKVLLEASVGAEIHGMRVIACHRKPAPVASKAAPIEATPYASKPLLPSAEPIEAAAPAETIISELPRYASPLPQSPRPATHWPIAGDSQRPDPSGARPWLSTKSTIATIEMCPAFLRRQLNRDLDHKAPLAAHGDGPPTHPDKPSQKPASLRSRYADPLALRAAEIRHRNWFGSLHASIPLRSSGGD